MTKPQKHLKPPKSMWPTSKSKARQRYTCKLTYSNHILSTTKNAYTQSAIMSRCFLYKNPHLLTCAFTSYVRPILEYATPVWSPHFSKDIDSLERVQRRFTKSFRNIYHSMAPVHESSDVTLAGTTSNRRLVSHTNILRNI